MIRFFPSDHACFYPIEETLDFISSADFPYFLLEFYLYAIVGPVRT